MPKLKIQEGCTITKGKLCHINTNQKTAGIDSVYLKVAFKVKTFPKMKSGLSEYLFLKHQSIRKIEHFYICMNL